MSHQMPRITIRSSDRYSALRAVGDWRLERIRAASVLVAGAGALGNEVLKNLALLGVGRVVLVDFDRIERANLTRSILYREADEGQSKARTAARAFRDINPDATVAVIEGDVAWEVGWGVFCRMDVVIGGLDNRLARVALNQHCWRAGKPWVDGALAESAGAVRVFVPPHSACYECTLSDADYREMNLRYSCQGVAVAGIVEGKIPTTPTMASVIGAMQVQEALRLLHGDCGLAGSELIYDARSHTLQLVQFKRREGCLGHSSLGPVVAVREFKAAKTTAGELLARAEGDLGVGAQIELDREVVVALRCPNGHANPWSLAARHRLRDVDVRCRKCGEECSLETSHTIQPRSPALQATLAQWGLPPAHIVRARRARQTIYYELTGDACGVLPWLTN